MQHYWYLFAYLSYLWFFIYLSIIFAESVDRITANWKPTEKDITQNLIFTGIFSPELWYETTVKLNGHNTINEDHLKINERTSIQEKK